MTDLSLLPRIFRCILDLISTSYPIIFICFALFIFIHINKIDGLTDSSYCR
jgi:hypothetical protein